MHYLFIQHNIDFEMLREQLRSRLTVAIPNDVAEGQQTRTHSFRCDKCAILEQSPCDDYTSEWHRGIAPTRINTRG